MSAQNNEKYIYDRSGRVRQPLTILLVFAIVVSSCRLFAPLFPPEPVQPPVLPAPPARLALPEGEPEEQALALADALAGDGDKLAGWLTLYDALGIPVIGEDGTPLGTTGDDPAGPKYWQVWYASVYDIPGRGILLSDVGLLLKVDLDNMQDVDLGPVLLDDLRNAMMSDDPQERLLGAFVWQRIMRGTSHADLLDPATTPDTVYIDLPTVQLLTWVILRQYVFEAARQVGMQPSLLAPANSAVINLASSKMAGRTVDTLSSSQPYSAKKLEVTGCSSALGDEDLTFWVNFAVNKLAGGLQLPGMEKAFRGTIEIIQERVGTSIDKIEKTSSRLGWANALAAALALAMQLSSVSVDGYNDPDPLVRTKKTSDGKETTIYWALTMDPGNLPDGNNGALCFLSFLANALGSSFSFPPGGRIAGAEMTFEGAAGFPELVLFGDYKQLKQDTNTNGEAQLIVRGRAQKKELPESSKPVDKEFSVNVSAQPEPANLNSMANIFFDGLTATSAAGVISGIIDILKTFHWDLGEHVFRLTDWKIPGFRYYHNYQGIDIKEGIICSFEKTFAIHAKLNYLNVTGTADYTFTPTSPTAGTMALTGTFSTPGGSITLTGSGTYEILSPDTETPIIRLDIKEASAKGAQGWGGMIPTGPMDMPLEPLETDECNGGK